MGNTVPSSLEETGQLYGEIQCIQLFHGVTKHRTGRTGFVWTTVY